MRNVFSALLAITFSIPWCQGAWQEYQSRNWTGVFSREKDNIHFLMSILNNSPLGAKLLVRAHLRAESQGKRLIDLIEASENSYTDTSLVRRYTEDNPSNISYDLRLKVYLNRNLNVPDAVRDLAHELTHFANKEAFNPYHNKFTLKDYIASVLESKGGEIDAFISECEILREIHPSLPDNKCSHLWKVTSEERFVVAQKLFYQVGGHYFDFKNEIYKQQIGASTFPISKDEPVFISSVASLPYPVAAMTEYFQVKNKVCQNEKKRISLIRARSGASRMPANAMLADLSCD